MKIAIHEQYMRGRAATYSHKDNAYTWALDRIAALEAELSKERSLSLRYRQQGVALEAELATERARLDWLISSSDEGKSDYLSD